MQRLASMPPVKTRCKSGVLASRYSATAVALKRAYALSTALSRRVSMSNHNTKTQHSQLSLEKPNHAETLMILGATSHETPPLKKSSMR